MVPSLDISKQVIAIVCGFLDSDDGCLLIDCALPIFLKFQYAIFPFPVGNNDTLLYIVVKTEWGVDRTRKQSLY